MDIFQTMAILLVVILGTLVWCYSRVGPGGGGSREKAGGNFLEESDLDDDSGFYIR